MKQRLEQDRAGASRLKLKRALLDALNKGHDFELPPTLVDNEFQAIWQQVTADLERSKRSFEDEGTTEEKAKAEYRDIAARRVRLGLILSEVGSRNQITVTDEEVSRALLERVRQFPGQERKVYDYYRNNPQLLAELRAPIFEDKAVDYVLELAKVTDTKVTPEELYADPDADHEYTTIMTTITDMTTITTMTTITAMTMIMAMTTTTTMTSATKRRKRRSERAEAQRGVYRPLFCLGVRPHM